jgi:hypothetical protein
VLPCELLSSIFCKTFPIFNEIKNNFGNVNVTGQEEEEGRRSAAKLDVKRIISSVINWQLISEGRGARDSGFSARRRARCFWETRAM